MSRVSLNPTTIERTPTDATGWRLRCFEARLYWEHQHGRRLTQIELAHIFHKCGGRRVSQTTISDWMGSVTVPGIEEIACLAKSFGVDPGWLAFGNATQAPRPYDGPEPVPIPRSSC